MDTFDPLDDAQECTTSARQWALLIITILAMNVSWWLCDMPLLFTRGFGQYLRSVIWQCFRMYTPSCAVVYALLHATTPEEEPYIYYLGPFTDGSKVRPETHPVTGGWKLSHLQLIRAVVFDSLTVVSTGLTIHQSINLPEGAPASGVAFSTWTYPTLPVGVLGLWLIFCTQMRWSRKRTFWLGMLVAIAIGAAVIAPVATLSPAAKKSKIWIAAVFGYAIMAVPVLALINGPGFVIAIGFGFIIRVGGVGIGALSDMAYFPFCELRNKAFGATYLAVGAIGAVLAIVGFWRYIVTGGLPNNPRNRSMYETFGTTPEAAGMASSR